MIASIAFYVFAGIAILAGALVVTSRNPVYSVLFLILAFFNAAGLFVLIGAEFLAMMLIVVYVGAVAVLFLFVVMMLDINFVAFRQGFVRYLPIGFAVGLVLLGELGLMLFAGGEAAPIAARQPIPPSSEVSNTLALGRVLYTDYVYLFQAAGLVLLVAMIGAIVLTHRDRSGVKRQKIAAQIARRRQSVELVKVPSGKGAAS